MRSAKLQPLTQTSLKKKKIPTCGLNSPRPCRLGGLKFFARFNISTQPAIFDRFGMPTWQVEPNLPSLAIALLASLPQSYRLSVKSMLIGKNKIKLEDITIVL